MAKQQKDTVREQTNSTDPRKPPRIVSHSEEPSCRLNICIPANTSTDSRLDNTRDVLVFTAITTERQRQRERESVCGSTSIKKTNNIITSNKNTITFYLLVIIVYHTDK